MLGDKPFRKRKAYAIHVTKDGQIQEPTMLRGGQKAIIALSIHLAALQVSEKGFMFMDEIDSGLDVVNQELMGRMTKEMTEIKQIIAISHRKNFAQHGD